MPGVIEGESSGDNLFVSHVSFTQPLCNTDRSDTSFVLDVPTASDFHFPQQVAAGAQHAKHC